MVLGVRAGEPVCSAASRGPVLCDWEVLCCQKLGRVELQLRLPGCRCFLKSLPSLGGEAPASAPARKAGGRGGRPSCVAVGSQLRATWVGWEPCLAEFLLGGQVSGYQEHSGMPERALWRRRPRWDCRLEGTCAVWRGGLMSKLVFTRQPVASA